MSQQIEPTYATFEFSKWLKEKEFGLPTLNWYHRETKKFNTNDLLFSMNKLTDNYSAPEQWQVVEWLRVNHGIWVYVKLGFGHEFVIQKTAVPFEIIYTDGTFKSPMEAYSAAFEHIKEYNLI